MPISDKSLTIKKLYSWQEEMNVASAAVRQIARNDRPIDILEAGCGSRWGIDLAGVQYVLTGIDTDENALDMRKNKIGDLDIAILEDLRTVDLGENRYDVIYNSNVLEHIDGAEIVLNNFLRWLRPGGILILKMPNRDSARGFLTRLTPFWLHILYYKLVLGFDKAGKPGFGPYPTYFDNVVSRCGIREYCEKNDLVIMAEYSRGDVRKAKPSEILEILLMWIVRLASLGRIPIEDSNLLYVIKCVKINELERESSGGIQLASALNS